MPFAVYISDTTVTLKQSQGHQTLNDNVDPKQGYNHAKFERSCFINIVREKAKIQEEEICQLSPLNMCDNQKQWYIHDLLYVI